MRRRHLAAGLVGATLLGMLAGWFRTLPTDIADQGSTSAHWVMPEAGILERSSAALDAAARSLPWVGGSGQIGDGPNGTASEWTLLGVLPQGNAVLVRAKTGDVITRVEVGQALPDGTRLTAVTRDAARIERDGCQIGRSLYPRPTGDTATSECNDEAPPRETSPP